MVLKSIMLAYWLFSFLSLTGSVIALPEEELLEFLGRQHFNQLFKDGPIDLTYEYTSPVVTDKDGNHIARYQRSANNPDEIFFNIEAFGTKYQLQLHKNIDVVANDLKFTSRNEDGSISNLETDFAKDCLYHGSLVSHSNSPVAISTCDGLTGLIRTPNEDLIIQSLPDSLLSKRSIDDHDHVMYKRPHTTKRFCPLHGHNIEERSSVRQFNHSRYVRQYQNAANAQKLTVETAVFFDLDLFNHFQKVYPRNTDSNTLIWILAVVNAMQTMYNDGTLTQKFVQFVVMKVEIFKTHQPGFMITTDAEQFLNNFCTWQSRINIQDDNNPNHWDHALMFTGLDIAFQNLGNSCAGLAPVRGMCNSRYTCTLSEGQGFLGVFVVTHEAGHNFGMDHDGEGNNCDSVNFMMSPAAHSYIHPWSRCSVNYLNQYLLQPVTVCLLDERRADDQLNHEKDNNVWMGQRYDADAQCQIESGQAYLKDRSQAIDQICQYILCINNNQDVKYSYPAFEGTPCGQGMWCSKRNCINKPRNARDPPPGNWGQYYELNKCSSSCVQSGSGIIAYQRDCNNPRNNAYLATCQGSRIMFDLCDDRNLCRQRISMDTLSSQACRKNVPNWATNLTGRGSQSFQDETGGCRVWCETRNNPQWTHWNLPYPDGTPCINKGFCVRGMCSTRFPST